MKIIAQLLSYGLAALLVTACNTSKKEDPQLKEAADVHLEAMQIEKQMKPQLAELVQLKNSINIQGRELTAEEIALVQQIEALEASYSFWEENHVEVPGHEHHDHDDHDHDHHHHHGPKLDLSPADMLLVQQEFRDSIRAIQQRVEATLQAAKQQ